MFEARPRGAKRGRGRGRFVRHLEVLGVRFQRNMSGYEMFWFGALAISFEGCTSIW